MAEAEKIYYSILAIRPDHFDSLHLLGVIFHQRGSYAEAIRRIDLALKVNPDHAPGLNNRGNERWSRLFEQIFRLDKWSVCQG